MNKKKYNNWILGYFGISLTDKYRYPKTDSNPEQTPTAAAPPGPISRLHTAPTPTPPARVEF